MTSHLPHSEVISTQLFLIDPQSVSEVNHFIETLFWTSSPNQILAHSSTQKLTFKFLIC